MFITKSYKKDHPNPMFYRDDFEILNGVWDFAFDKKNEGEKNRYFESFPDSVKIIVPFSYLTRLSGINLKERVDNIWYQKTIIVKNLEKRYLLHLEGSDYLTKIWVNSIFAGSSTGAYHRLTFDITDLLVEGENKITIKCEDDFSIEKPRGKQRFLKRNFLCWYEETTGIYKTVWIEKVNPMYIKDFKTTPSYSFHNVTFDMSLSSLPDYIEVEISYKDKLIKKETLIPSSTDFSFKLTVPKEDFHAWDVLKPELYDVSFKLVKDQDSDKVLSYFAFREIKTEGTRVLLNGKELYQKLILDQGYFQGGDLTPSSEDDLLYDIKDMIDMGFNGCRKHQKREDDRFYYFADALGYLVWAEMPSMYRFTKKSVETFKKEWMLIVKELYNHPSIIIWTPLNESWGVFRIKGSKKVQNFAKDVYDMTKSYDNTRLVVGNDGWEHVKTDLVTIHLYQQDPVKLKDALDFASKNMILKTSFGNKKRVFAKGYSYNGEPILITEFGGTAYKDDAKKNWGYGKAVKSEEEYEERLRKLIKVVKDSKAYSGYCYTQLSDVKQEINGLYTMKREPKIPKEIMKEIQN